MTIRFIAGWCHNCHTTGLLRRVRLCLHSPVMTGSFFPLVMRRRPLSLTRAPLLPILIAAVLLSLAFHLHGPPEIRVTPQQLNAMRKEYESSLGRRATQLEVRRLAEEYLDNEILYREALRRGLAQDTRVREVLIQTMRTSLRPVVPEPSDAELVALREQNPAIYRYPAMLSFEHVSFTDAREIPQGLLERLRAGAPPDDFGDPQMQLAIPLLPARRSQIEYDFGAEFTAALTRCPQGEWTGPLASIRGVHFVRLLKYEPERDMPMSELRPTLIANWTGRRQAQAVSERLAAINHSYRVTMPPILPEMP